MRTIPYNSASVSMRKALPTAWDLENLTGVNIQIVNDSGGDLLAETAATLYTATTINGAVSSGTSTIVLDSGSGDVAQGDVLRFVNPQEDVVVRSYATASKIVQLEYPLYYDHDDGADVYPTWATYTLDTSDTSVFEENLDCTIVWSAVGIPGATVYDTAVVRDRSYSPSAYARRFQVMYPVEYRLVEHDINEFLDECIKECSIRLSYMGVDVDMAGDTEMFDTLYIHYARFKAASLGGDSMSYERETAKEDWLREESSLLESAPWIDSDGDQARDDEEYTDYGGFPVGRAF